MYSLLVGRRYDPHLISLKEEIERRGKSCIIFDSDKMASSKETISYSFCENSASLSFRGDNGRLVLSDEISSVFWRPKVRFPEICNFGDHDDDLLFRLREWDKAIRGIPYFLRGAFWMSVPSAQEKANNKIYQLICAKACGFMVPQTVISNDAKEIEHLFGTGEVIYKTLSGPKHSKNKFIMTSIVDIALIRSNVDKISTSPCLFQRYINKKYELRVYFAASNIVAVMIDSQRMPLTKIDWRTGQQEKDIFSRFDLDFTTQKKIIDLMSLVDLTHGCIDLIVTENDDIVFLEINPNGQWLWLDSHISENITSMIVDNLK